MTTTNEERVAALGPNWLRTAASRASQLVACPTCSAPVRSGCSVAFVREGKKLCRARIEAAADYLVAQHRHRATTFTTDISVLTRSDFETLLAEWERGLNLRMVDGSEIRTLSAVKALALSGRLQVVLVDEDGRSRGRLWDAASDADEALRG